MSDTVAPGINPAEYQRTLNQAISRKQRIRELEATLAERDKQLATLTKERDEFASVISEMDTKVKSFEAAPSEHQKEIDRLKGEIKQRDYRSAWDKAAQSFKGTQGETVHPSALDALWRLSSIEMDADTPDEGKLQEALRAAVAANPYVLQAPPQGGGGAVAPGGSAPSLPAKPPGPGVSRGVPDTTQPTPDARSAALARLQATTGRSNPFRIA